MYTLISRVVQEEEAWEECEECGGKGWKLCDVKRECHSCNGLGGKWHEALIRESDGSQYAYLRGGDPKHLVTRSSLLIREHQVCSVCKGTMKTISIIKRNELDFTADEPCTHCLVDGKPTGAEPGTAGPWRVKE